MVRYDLPSRETLTQDNNNTPSPKRQRTNGQGQSSRGALSARGGSRGVSQTLLLFLVGGVRRANVDQKPLPLPPAAYRLPRSGRHRSRASVRRRRLTIGLFHDTVCTREQDGSVQRMWDGTVRTWEPEGPVQGMWYGGK